LILNNLVHSIQNIIQGNTMVSPYHVNGDKLMTFDFIVSNPPFKLDFSDQHSELDTKENKTRFFAGVPKIKPKDKDKMEIYLLFLQHIIFSLSKNGKAAIVVPTGFISAKAGIELRIREELVEKKMLRGVISMPSNIFATTGTNVSVLFIDKSNIRGNIVLMDASNLGTTIKDGKNKKTLLSEDEEKLIIDSFNKHEVIDRFTAVVSYEKLKLKNYSLSAGQYFDIKVDTLEISHEDFKKQLGEISLSLKDLLDSSNAIDDDLISALSKIKYVD
jgi:type I restriction enzyme M protein